MLLVGGIEVDFPVVVDLVVVESVVGSHVDSPLEKDNLRLGVLPKVLNSLHLLLNLLGIVGVQLQLVPHREVV